MGPTYYGVKTGAKVNTVTESTTTYDSSISGIEDSAFGNMTFKVFPNPTSDIIAIQINGVNNQDLAINMYDIQGALIQETKMVKGQTISYFDIQTLYAGTYLIKISTNASSVTKKITIEK